MSLDRKRLDDSTLPLVCGLRGRHSFSSKPASFAKAQTRSTRTRLPPLSDTSADMLSVTHSLGTPPRRMMVRYMHLTRSSAVREPDLTYTCLREYPSVAANTLNSNSSPSRFAILTDSFQSNCSCSPGGVSNLGWGSAPPSGPMAMPLLRMNCVKAL